jgi:hypothetical protein
MLVSLDGGKTYVPAREGVRLIYAPFVIHDHPDPARVTMGELHVSMADDHVTVNVWEDAIRLANEKQSVCEFFWKAIRQSPKTPEEEEEDLRRIWDAPDDYSPDSAIDD